MAVLNVPSEYNNLRTMDALETIVTNLDKIPIESLEEFVKVHNLTNWTKHNGG